MADILVDEDMDTVEVNYRLGETRFEFCEFFVYGEKELSGKTVAYIYPFKVADGKPVKDLKVCGYKERQGFFNKIFLRNSLVPIPEEERQSIKSGLSNIVHLDSIDFLDNASMTWR